MMILFLMLQQVSYNTYQNSAPREKKKELIESENGFCGNIVFWELALSGGNLSELWVGVWVGCG